MFFWYDYLILIVVLFGSTLIGLYFGCFGSKQATTNEYLSGGKKMTIIPIAISVTVSHFSAITIAGVPADVYKYGAFYWLSCISSIFIFLGAIFIYYPVLFNGELTSIYEYLENRFDKNIRLLGSVLYVLFENLLLPVIVYSPALMLSTYTGISPPTVGVIICGICICYTAIGGLRTVIWTDILQFVVVMLSFFIVCGFGIKAAGGISSVWNTAAARGRLDIFDFDLDPTKKDSFWICVIGSTIRLLYYLCLSQSSVQKYLSLPSFRHCRLSIFVSTLCWNTVNTFAVFLGLTIFANYANCDPVSNKTIRLNDEIVPFYVTQVAKNIPGVSGLFNAAVISAAISSLSSSLNSLSGVIYNDFFKKCLRKSATEKTTVTILKIIVVLQGILCACLVVIIQYLGEIVPMAVGISGIIDGPSLGLVTLGILFPKANSQGALWGTIGGMIFVTVMFCSATYYKHKKVLVYPPKPMSVDGCTVNSTFISNNFSFLNKFSMNNSNRTKINSVTTREQPFILARISYHYYCFIGAIVTIIMGLIISYIVKIQKHPSRTKASANYPLLENFDIK